MMSEKCFTEQELIELTRTGMEKYFLKANEVEAAKELVKQMNQEWQATHDLYRDWITAILSSIGRKYGDEVLFETLRETVSLYMKPLSERVMKGGDRRSVVNGMAAAIRGHLGAFSKIPRR